MLRDTPQEKLAELVGVVKREFEVPEADAALEAKVAELAEAKVTEAVKIQTKQERYAALADNRAAVQEALLEVLRTVVAPLVEADGGELYLVSAEGGQLRLHLAGTCCGCPGAEATSGEVITPAVLLTATMVLKRQPFAYVLSMALLVLLALLAPQIVAQSVFQVRAGVSYAPGEIVGPICGFATLAIAALYFIVRILRGIQD